MRVRPTVPSAGEEYVSRGVKFCAGCGAESRSSPSIAAAAVGCGARRRARRRRAARSRRRSPCQPTVEIISPRNGAVQRGLAVVVKAEVTNFQLAPAPLRQRTPNSARATSGSASTASPTASTRRSCRIAEESPIGHGRLVGASFDFPQVLRPERRARRADRLDRQLLARRPGRRSSTTTSDPASTGWSSPSPRTTARRRPTTTSPTSRSCRGPAAPARNPARAARSPAPRPKASSSTPGRRPLLHFV